MKKFILNIFLIISLSSQALMSMHRYPTRMNPFKSNFPSLAKFQPFTNTYQYLTTPQNFFSQSPQVRATKDKTLQSTVFEQSNKKTKTNKFFKALGAAMVAGTAYKYRKKSESIKNLTIKVLDSNRDGWSEEQIEQKDFYNLLNLYYNVEDAKITDPGLYEVFLQIKNNLGIKEDIELKIFSNELLSFLNLYMFASHKAFVITGIPVVFFNKNFTKNKDKEYILFAIAHELAHIKQFLGHKDIYGGSIDSNKNPLKLDSLKTECSADACAAGCIGCPKCLEIIQKHKPPHKPFETGSGYFTDPFGYFSDQDIQLYIDRAKEEGECTLCDAHRLNKENPSFKDFLPKK